LVEPPPPSERAHGRWVAFGSDATRRLEVYVRRLDDATRASALHVSTDGGDYPRWRGDGRELYYVDANGRLLAVPVDLGAKPTVGQRLLLNRTLIEDRVPVLVVLGWLARLERGAAR